MHWVKQLKPDADDALLIAAHDIERAFRLPERKGQYHREGFRDRDLLTHHQERGAALIGEFLAQEGAPKKLITRVQHLVRAHEKGGDADQDLLKDCDSISFFETNAEHFITDKAPELGKEKVSDKFRWMFERISSEKAKRIARPLYEDALRRPGQR